MPHLSSDAVVTAESPPTHNSVLASNGVVESDGITITVQSSTERVMYNLAEVCHLARQNRCMMSRKIPICSSGRPFAEGDGCICVQTPAPSVRLEVYF